MKRIKHNKRLVYFITVFALFLFCIILNLSFSAFTYSTKNEAFNIIVGNLNYNITIDGINEGTITAANNAITRKNMIVFSDNQIDTKYEITYEIYSDSSLTTKVTSVEGLTVEYSSKSTDSITGTISSQTSKSIRLIIINTTNTTYYLKIGINAGFSHNDLELKRLISNEFIEEDIAVVTYVNGRKQADFPTTSGYTTSVVCKNAMGSSTNATGTLTWDTDAWVLTLSNIDEKEVKCNAYFTESA